MLARRWNWFFKDNYPPEISEGYINVVNGTFIALEEFSEGQLEDAFVQGETIKGTAQVRLTIKQSI